MQSELNQAGLIGDSNMIIGDFARPRSQLARKERCMARSIKCQLPIADGSEPWSPN